MDKRLLKIVDKITSKEFIIADFVGFALVPLALTKWTRIRFSDTDCIKMLAVYVVLLFVDAAITNFRLKDFLKRYYPAEYSALFDSDSVSAIIRGTFGNLHANIYINSVLDDPDCCDDIVYILYEQLTSKRNVLLALEFAGSFFIFFFYTFFGN